MVFIMISKLKSHHQILISMIAGYIIGYSFDFSKIFIPLGDIFIRLLTQKFEKILDAYISK